MRKRTIKVDVLGTTYTIHTGIKHDEDEGLKDRFGYVTYVERKIVICDLDSCTNWGDTPAPAKLVQYRATLRHELIHAFLYESGLWSCSGDVEAWATNEEMVDWLALQFPKINRAMMKVGAIYFEGGLICG